MSTKNSVQLQWPRHMNELPKEVFVRQDVFELEKERIFRGAEWHPVAHGSEVPNVGDFKTFSVGGVPLLIARRSDKTVGVLYNSCAHRGNQVETGTSGNRKLFQCPYHRWTFSLEGKLVACPNSDEYVPGFKKEDYPLGSPRTEVFHDLVFITMSADTPPLEEWLGPVKETIREALGDGGLRLLGSQKVTFKANWKALADNDGYHGPLLHKAFALLKWQGGKGRQYVDPHHGHIGFEGEIKPVTHTTLIKDASLISFRADDRFQGGSRLVGLFPVTGIVKHLDIINIRFVVAQTVDDTECHFLYFCRLDDDEETVRQRVRQSSNLIGPCGMVSMEDASIFHRIHIGSNAPGNAIFQKGVKSVDRVELEVGQNDESGNLARWEYYRKIMGFERAEA
jgi:anthranilate 1,2-dioxygenase large subunit